MFTCIRQQINLPPFTNFDKNHSTFQKFSEKYKFRTHLEILLILYKQICIKLVIKMFKFKIVQFRHSLPKSCNNWQVQVKKRTRRENFFLSMLKFGQKEKRKKVGPKKAAIDLTLSNFGNI